MVSELEVVSAFASIMLLELLLLWFIYHIRAHDFDLGPKGNRKKLYYSQVRSLFSFRHSFNLRRRVVLYTTLYACVVILFWGLMIIFLKDESYEIIRLTWFLLPTLIAWGILDGYADKAGKMRGDGLTVEKLRPVVHYLYNESHNGNTDAKTILVELQQRKDEVGILTREIMSEIE